MAEKELINIHWKETSGVDYAANNEKGWLVMKTANGSGLANLVEQLEEEDRVQKNLHELLRLLQSLSENDLPDEVQSALGTVMDFLQTQTETEEGSAEDKQASEGSKEPEDDEPKTNKSLIRKLLALLQKGEGTEEPPEGDAEGDIDNDDDAQKAGHKKDEEDKRRKQTKKMLELMPAFLEKKVEIMQGDDELEVKKEKISALLTEMQSEVMSDEVEVSKRLEGEKVIKVHDTYFSVWEVADILRKFAREGTSPKATLSELNSANMEAVRAHLMEDVQRFEASQSAIDMLDAHMQSN